MKKSLRLLSALLALCVLAAAFPPVGLAASSVDDLRDLITRTGSGGVLDLGGASVNANDVSVDGAGKLAPFIINKPITIQNGSITVRAGGIVLEENVTFSNIEFSFPSGTEGGNFIAANGHTLTLENVSCANNAYSFSLFCGTFTGNNHPTVSVPNPGTEGTIILKGKVVLQGGLSTGNIYAGNVYRTRDGNGILNKVFNGNATISVQDQKSSQESKLGTVYACGATQDGGVASADGAYTVSGKVSITGDVPNVHGMGATAAEVIYQGSGNLAERSFLDISSLSVERGNLLLNTGSTFRDQAALSISSDAFLNIKNMGNLSVSNFQGGGSLILGQDQTLTITGAVSGETTVGVEKIFNGASDLPTLNHTYIIAQASSETSFKLAPPNVMNPPTLERDGSGNWIAKGKTSGGDEGESKLVSLALRATQAGKEEPLVYVPITQSCTGAKLSLDTLPLVIEVNETQANFNQDTNYYEAGGLQITVGDFDDIGDSLMVCNAANITAPVPVGTYRIKITVPSAYTESGSPITASCTLTVGDSAPTVKFIDVPTANPGLKWTGEEQTGVNEGTGYTLTGHKGTAVDNYTAIATLEPGYQWTGGSTDSKTINWSIAKADGPAAPGNLSAAAPTTANGSDGRITGTTSEMEYDTDKAFPSARPCGNGSTGGLAAGTYYVRLKATETHEPGAYTPITVPAYGAPAVKGISFSSTGHKTEYKVGEPLDVTGLTICVMYSDSTTKTVQVTESMVRGFDSSRAAERQTLTITYEGRTAEYTIRITAPEEPGKPKYQVTLSNLGDGGSGGGSYEEGSTVTIRAGSRSGYTFSGWQQPEGVTLADRNSPETSFTMPGRAVTLQATWTRNGGTPPSHAHVWASAWKAGGTHHWHDCTASGCPITQDSLKDGYAAHTAGDWVVDQAATSFQSGTRHRSCTVCGYEMARETIPATGGDPSYDDGAFSDGGSSGGGSSSGGSSNNTSTVKNPDGSTTATSTNKTTGTVTETTQRPDGSKTVVETKKDGTITTTATEKDGSTAKTVARPDGTSETTVKQASGLTASVQEDGNGARADVSLPSKVVQESQSGGRAVALPIPELPGANASITVRTGSARPVRVGIPVRGDEYTTVACLVNSDGSETILKTALLAGGQMTVSIPDGATVRIRDNGGDFQDTRGHWAENVIDFVAARELFSGKDIQTFAPEDSMSRAMLMTVLARLDGVDADGGDAYEKGLAWAVSQGISDGQNPDGQVTREQFVVMLHRCTGSPAATERELRFSDAEKISAYAREAVRWAMENGILNGYEDGSLLPGGETTRAQAAAMLARYVKFLNQQ